MFKEGFVLAMAAITIKRLLTISLNIAACSSSYVSGPPWPIRMIDKVFDNDAIEA